MRQHIYLFIIIIICLLCFYILIRESAKRHRFAQAVYHVHFVNHAIRDHIAGLHLRGEMPLSNILLEIVNAISSCFSILEGCHCRCSIKEVTKENRPQIVTAKRDSISEKNSINTGYFKHYLDENTDFNNLWNGMEESFRWYVGYDLITLWKEEKYFNSSFQAYGLPKRKHSRLGFCYVTDWHLPYNSTIVWPIRFIPNREYWPPSKSKPTQSSNLTDIPHVWGFLCIDARIPGLRRFFDSYGFPRIFGSHESYELGAAFADALYTLLQQAEYIANRQPAQSHTATSLPSQENANPSHAQALQPLFNGQNQSQSINNPKPTGEVHE